MDYEEEGFLVLMWQAIAPMVYTVLFAALCWWYVALIRAMWPRDSVARTVLGMLLIATMLSRLYWCQQYPPGFYVDEIKDLGEARTVFNGIASPFTDFSGSGMPRLLYAVIEGPLDWVLNSWWTIRAWPFCCGVLAVLGAYAVVEAFGCGIVAGLFAAVCFAILPWAIVYGLSSWGGELFWHELIVVWVIARLVRESPSAFLVLSGSLALVCLSYDYFNGKAVVWAALAMLPMLGRRAWAIGVMLVCVALWFYPVVRSGNKHALVGFWPSHIVGSTENPLIETVLPQLQFALHGLYDSEVSTSGSMNIGRVLNTPLPLLVLAGTGWLVARWQQKWLLAAIFLFGLTPGVLTRHVTSHHILMAMVAIPLAAALAVHRPWLMAALFCAWLTAISLPMLATFQWSSWDQALPR